LKICISVGQGGHLDQSLQIKQAFKGHEKFFVTAFSKITSSLKNDEDVYFVREHFGQNSSSNIIKTFLLILYQIYTIPHSIYILLKMNPDVIICNGGPASLTLTYLGKILGINIIYLESLTRIDDISLRAKLIYPISDLFLVQWKSLEKKYEKAKYWGKVI